MQANGSVKVNAGKLDAALANLPEMKKFFANSDIDVQATTASHASSTR
jgi:hypothetical protein